MSKKRPVTPKAEPNPGAAVPTAVPPGVRPASAQGRRREGAVKATGPALVVPDFETSSAVAEFVATLNAALASTPRTLTLRFIGTHNLQPDAALLVYEMVRHRQSATRIITESWSALLGPSILPWLAGDVRRVRSSTYFYFRSLEGVLGRDGAAVDFQDQPGSDRDPETISVHLGAVDYEECLRRMNEYLPVREWGGKVIRPSMLEEFGLIGESPLDALLLGRKPKGGDKPGSNRAKARGRATE